MFRILVIDDDSLARMRLKTLLDWQKVDCEICAEAADGQVGIEMIQAHAPDIVITDMNMPVLDGVAVARWIHDHNPAIQTIALSGYDDFNYVKESMKLGALDYIIKHRLDEKALLAVLEQAKRRILQSQDEAATRQQLNKQIQRARSYMREQFLQEILLGEITDGHEIEESLRKLELDISMTNVTVILVEVDDYPFLQEKLTDLELKKLLESFQEIAQQILNDSRGSRIVHMDRGRYAVLYSLDQVFSTLYVYNQIYQVIERIRTSMQRYLQLTACYAVSPICPHLQEVSRYFKKAEELMKEKFYQGKDRLFMEGGERITKNDFITLSPKHERRIVEGTHAGKQEVVEAVFNEIFNDVVEQRINPKSTHMIVAELINIASRIAISKGVDPGEVFYSMDVPYAKMQKYENVADVKEWIRSVYQRLLDSLSLPAELEKPCSDNVNMALAFIRRNHDKDISLEDMAEFIGVSASYLSRKFKEETGTSYVKYLNLVRVEQAKILIERRDGKIKDICLKVGFRNYNYFFKVFKEITGMTPLEYEVSAHLK
ncbi:response regulator transcription factor [Anaerotalea alkaliphila]|uniref:Stage 0 sporulation protein A homolog n=1 Tax=Anaerotalea alkaliphila TaxID=2662126 RepID=A0A7X5HWP1_9FIRM|nr:response regulator [Anaerotalea alkaliphila]NDL68038.1 response regulator [Anaerotalea alkaliphila]